MLHQTLRVQASARGATTGPHNIPMPRGVWWLDRAAHNHDVVYGQNFVLQRPKRGGPGLVLSPQISSVQIIDPPAPDAPVQLAVRDAKTQAQPPSLPLESSAWEWDITDYNFVEGPPPAEGEFDGDGSGSSAWPASNCLGIVLHADSVTRSKAEGPSSRNPRRTRKVRFTCNLCGNTYVKPINPHAWTNGSVFARCDECNVIHKLKDGLKLFHEYNVWPTPDLSQLKIPAGLPQKPTLDYHDHPALYTPEEDA